MLTIIIPSKTEIFLKRTIEDVLEKAHGDIEIFPVLDGYEVPEEEIVKDPRVRYVYLEPTQYTKKRHGINHVIRDLSTGEYVMSLDAHCMLAPGFDLQLIKDHQPDWIQVPRRHRLDAENWCLQTQVDKRPPIDYEYLIYPGKFDPVCFHGFKWDEKSIRRKDVMIDKIITMQASMWFMTKKWFLDNDFMQIEGFKGWGQEAEELCFKTWLRGGKVMVNKNTWYAHLHKGPRYGRMYWMSRQENRESYAYSYDYFMNDRDPRAVHSFGWLLDKFLPMPGWPKNWRDKLGYKEN